MTIKSGSGCGRLETTEFTVAGKYSGKTTRHYANRDQGSNRKHGNKSLAEGILAWKASLQGSPPVRTGTDL